VHEYCALKGVAFSALQKAGVGYDVLQDSLIFPYYLGTSIVAIKLRNAAGGKYNLKGSKLSLFNLQQAVSSTSSTVVIVEGETDCLKLQEVLDKHEINIPVIATPGAVFKAEWKRHLQQFDRVICVPQADIASQKLVDTLAGIFNSKLQIVHLPWKPLTWGKDIAEYLLQHTDEYLLKLLNASTTVTQRLVSINELLDHPEEEIEYVIPGLIERGTKTILLGEPKTFKTWIALQMMHSLAMGTPLMGMPEWTPEEGGKSLLVEEEGSRQRLVQRVKSIFGDGRSESANFLHRQLVRLDDEESLEKLLKDVYEKTPDLLILDPYVNLHSQDENSAAGTQIVMDGLNKILALNSRLAIVLIHHTAKERVTPRGSTVLWGAVDMQIHVARTKASNVIEMTVKGRDVVSESTLPFVFTGSVHKPVSGVTKGVEKVAESSQGETDMMKPKVLEVRKAVELIYKKKPGKSFTKTALITMMIGICHESTAVRALDMMIAEGRLIAIQDQESRGRPYNISWNPDYKGE
jgi:hypothetical protein